MKNIYLFLFNLLLILSPVLVYGSEKTADNKKGLKTIRILAIGNSFSDDAVEHYLYGLAKDAGVEIVIGNMYIGGCSFETHWKNASTDAPAYEYRKIDADGNKTVTKDKKILEALVDETWDFISFQQASPTSGMYYTYEKDMPELYDYVLANNPNKKTKYILHQTWAYASNSTHKGFANYDNNQIKMYYAICDAVKRASKLRKFDIIVPSGTAIQNARTSFIGDNMCRDGYHLDLNIGRYTASCTWFEKVTGKNVIGNKYAPEALSPIEIEIAQNAAHMAVKKPFEVTRMVNYNERTVPLLETVPEVAYTTIPQFATAPCL